MNIKSFLLLVLPEKMNKWYLYAEKEDYRDNYIDEELEIFLFIELYLLVLRILLFLYSGIETQFTEHYSNRKPTNKKT
jgi:hypothetical protein